MCVLSDVDLQKLYPQYKGATGAASIDLHVGETLLSWPRYERRDPRIDQSATWNFVGLHEDAVGRFWVLVPGVRYLATTREPIRIPEDMAGQLSARSSWGRDGLAVICGPAGWLDPGYVGRPTLELSVVGSELVLWPDASILQLILHQLTSECDQPYQGKYLADTEPVPSRMFREISA